MKWKTIFCCSTLNQDRPGVVHINCQALTKILDGSMSLIFFFIGIILMNSFYASVSLIKSFWFYRWLSYALGYLFCFSESTEYRFGKGNSVWRVSRAWQSLELFCESNLFKVKTFSYVDSILFWPKKFTYSALKDFSFEKICNMQHNSGVSMHNTFLNFQGKIQKTKSLLHAQIMNKMFDIIISCITHESFFFFLKCS